MRHFRRHADALAQRGVRVDGLADVHRVCALRPLLYLPLVLPAVLRIIRGYAAFR